MKTLHPGYTYALFSKRAGIKSPNYLKVIIDGKKRLTSSNIFAFARALKLSGSETEYFESMVRFKQALDSDERRHYSERMRRASRSKSASQRKLEADILFSDPLFPAVLVSLGTRPDGLSEREVSNIFSMQPSRTARLLGELVHHNIAQLADGRYKFSDTHVIVNKENYHRSQKDFLRNQLLLSQRELEKNYSKGAKFYSHSFSVGADGFRLRWEDIKKFVENITIQSDLEQPATEVLQLNIQLFSICELNAEKS